MNKSDREKLLAIIEKHRRETNTPEKSRAFLVKVGIILEDGSPSPNYHSQEEIDNYHLDRYYKNSPRDWLILKKIWFEVPGFVGKN